MVCWYFSWVQVLHECVVLDDEVTNVVVVPEQRDHGLGLIAHDITSRYQLDIILYPDNFTSSLGFYILFSDVFAFVIEEAMGISCPCNASQVHFVLLSHMWLDDTADGAVTSVLVHDLLDFFVLQFLLLYDFLG